MRSPPAADSRTADQGHVRDWSKGKVATRATNEVVHGVGVNETRNRSEKLAFGELSRESSQGRSEA